MAEMSIEEYRRKAGLTVTVKSKYGAQPQIYQGHRYASKAELAFRLHLDLLKVNGKVDWYLFQTPIHLPAGEGVKGTRYVMDYLVKLKDGPVVGVDVKGRDTRTSIVKRSVASSVVAFKIETVKQERKGGFQWP